MATTPEAAVIARLKATAAVNAAVGGRITPQVNTQEFTLPLIVVRRVGQAAGALLAGVNRLSRFAVQIDVYAVTEVAGAAIGAAVLDGVDGWQDKAGAGVHGVFLDDSSQDTTDDPYRVWGQTLGVWFRKPD